MYKKTDKLCEEAKIIREEVFVKEQGFLEEFDDIDDVAKHLVFYVEGKPAATCRYYRGTAEGEYIAGRIAVRQEFRGRNLGSILWKFLRKMSKRTAEEVSFSQRKKESRVFMKRAVLKHMEKFIWMNTVNTSI